MSGARSSRTLRGGSHFSRWAVRVAAVAMAMAALVLAPGPSRAQDLIFEEEDVPTLDTGYDEEGEGEGGEGDILDTSEFLPLVTGMVIPGEAIDPAASRELSDLLLDELRALEIVDPVDYLDLETEFDIMGSELARECAFDPVCLGRVGRTIAVDEIIIGRATGGGGRVTLTLDRIDVESRSVMRYRSVDTDGSLGELTEAIRGQVPQLYDIRPDRPGPITGPTGPSTFQVAAAWTTLGLGVVSLGVGIGFGVKSNNLEDEVTSGELRDDDIFVMTQVEAQQKLDEANDDALLANIFLGTGVALLGASALLFFITPGEDIGGEVDQSTAATDLLDSLTPTVREDGWGIIGTFEF